MKESFVYKIESPSGKYYIGSTNNLQRRIREHIKGSKNPHSLYIQQAAAKYGSDQMKITVLATCNTREEAYQIEEEYLNIHFEDKLCMNAAKKATGFDTESGRKAGDHNNRFDIAAYMKANPNKRVRKGQAKVKQKEKVIPINKQEAELTLTCREFDQWKRDNRPNKYAVKNPDGEIIYIKERGLTKFCNNNNINMSHLQARGYANEWFYTKDLSEEGISNLKEAIRSNKGNSKEYEIYLNDEYLYTIINLKEWCRDNDLSYAACINRIRGIVKGAYKGYTFKIK